MYNRPANIAMLSVHTSPIAALGGKKTGGMNVYVRELSKHLGQCHMGVDVFTRRQHPNTPSITQLPGTNTRVIQIDAGPAVPLSPTAHLPHITPFAELIVDFAQAERITYDVIHSHYWLSGLVGMALQEAWGTHTPLIQMFHTLGRMKNRIATTDTLSDSHERVVAEKRIMDHADRLIAATPAERLQMMWLYGADMHAIEVISPGVDRERFHPTPKAAARQALGIPPERFMVMFVGRIEPLKGIDSLIEAAAAVRGHDPRLYDRLEVAIIGGDPTERSQPGTEMHRLGTLAEQLDVDSHITLYGAKPQSSLQQYYAAADAVVMPSHYESFGMVALEAMACGTPVIASEVGGLAFLIEDGKNGFHVPYQAPEAIAEHLLRLAHEPELARTVSRCASEYARQFSWPAIASAIYETYMDALNERAA